MNGTIKAGGQRPRDDAARAEITEMFCCLPVLPSKFQQRNNLAVEIASVTVIRSGSSRSSGWTDGGRARLRVYVYSGVFSSRV